MRVEHGGNIQALCAPDGFPWSCRMLALPTLADGGYDGAGIGVGTPVKRPANDHASTRSSSG
jgi:hypothetical protein